MAKQRCMVRVTPMVTPEALCTAIESTKTLSAEQVVRNKSGEEVKQLYVECSRKPWCNPLLGKSLKELFLSLGP